MATEDKSYTQADLDAAIAKAVGPLTERLDAADAKNTGLLDDLKKAQRELRAAKDITPEAHQAEIERADKAEAALAQAQADLKTATATAEKATKALEAESGFTQRLLVENGLRDALSANGVTNAVHQKAAMAMLASGVQIAAEGDTRVAKVGDKGLADYVKEWAGGDEGKHFVSAPMNSGGGAPGGSQNGGGGKQLTRAQFDALNPVDKVAHAKAGGAVVDA